MTDIMLQDALISEMQYLLEHHSLKKLEDEEWTDFKIYRQDPPYKNDDEPEDQEDFILVMIDEEDTDSDGQWVVTVHFLINIVLYNVENQGNVILLNLMNQIYNHLKVKHIIGGSYVMDQEAHKRLNHECLLPFYECDLITKWKLPELTMQWPDEPRRCSGQEPMNAKGHIHEAEWELAESEKLLEEAETRGIVEGMD